MEKTINLSTKDFIDFYDSCAPKVREVLKGLFNPVIMEYLIYSIKTFEDASIRVLGKVVEFDKSLDAASVASMKLKIISEALNDGWSPEGSFYYPSFGVENGVFKAQEIKSGNINYECTEFPNNFPEFYFRNRELADYAAQTFISLWKDFYIKKRV